MRVLIVNHPHSTQCGVHAHGLRMYSILTKHSGEHAYGYLEPKDSAELTTAVKHYGAELVITNYYPGLMPWLEHTYLSVPHLALCHEVIAETLCSPGPKPFDAWMVSNPKLGVACDGWYRTVRPLPSPVLTGASPTVCMKERPWIGTFGFAFANKGFVRLAEAVVSEYTEGAVLRMHVTKAHFHGNLPMTDPNEVHDAVAQVLKGTKIGLHFSDHAISDEDLVKWLAVNQVNCLLYGANTGRGASSAVDFCVAAGRPILISKSQQFDHVNDKLPVWPTHSIKETVKIGSASVSKLQVDWSHVNFATQLNAIVHFVAGH